MRTKGATTKCSTSCLLNNYVVNSDWKVYNGLFTLFKTIHYRLSLSTDFSAHYYLNKPNSRVSPERGAVAKVTVTYAITRVQCSHPLQSLGIRVHRQWARDGPPAHGTRTWKGIKQLFRRYCNGSHNSLCVDTLLKGCKDRGWGSPVRFFYCVVMVFFSTVLSERTFGFG